MELYSNGVVHLSIKANNQIKAVVKLYFPKAKADGFEISFTDESGYLMDDLEKMVQDLQDIGVICNGTLEYYGDYEGAYVIDESKVTEVSLGEQYIRTCQVKELLDELNRRMSISSFSTEELEKELERRKEK